VYIGNGRSKLRRSECCQYDGRTCHTHGGCIHKNLQMYMYIHIYVYIYIYIYICIYVYTCKQATGILKSVAASVAGKKDLPVTRVVDAVMENKSGGSHLEMRLLDPTIQKGASGGGVCVCVCVCVSIYAIYAEGCI